MGAESQNPDNNLHAVYQVLVGNESKEDLTAWVDTYGLHNTTVRDLTSATLDALGPRECNYIVDTATMTILWKACGRLGDNDDVAIVPALAELDRLLSL